MKIQQKYSYFQEEYTFEYRKREFLKIIKNIPSEYL